ncbi:ABC transporter ATP-binding protein [Cytobacillus firmus]|nr:ABC transporter ATP-binding protein [Cytobacillus firmus]MBG9543500.1 bacitracin ABC transporter ATP-binding protein [Cytobacillus firmus]MBG9549465.1 bacitracin ABC transporter ATP-binding protein [Cytobacillus firmus]MBG9559546.1 bacitracin ABC transporter ATP-binding protein [Cytobacillus firmus]MBG9577328.1 bacitracin ABC transporter ATP-binding protein [Cytobacillus firmus]MBG9602532.1 bacitracin ABC transporter ATP-binding protein [Cytobacillus firmus]
MDTLVEIQDVTKVIKGRTIIDSVSFDVKKGEVFGFLGPNGAGKTTTIRMLVGLIGITSGDIKILGSSIKTDFEKAVSHIGAIVENPEMYKFLSGYQNLIHYARMSKGVTKEKIDETVELVGLADRIHDKVRTYSLGMRQRLGLAQCLLHDPQILVLDEPTNGLDPAGIREIRDHLRMLAREREMAVIVSSHLLSEMEMMCDRIGIIQNGKLIDVQHISDFVQGKEKVYEVEVDDPDKAQRMLKGIYPELPIQVTGNSVFLPLVRDGIPEMVKEFVSTDIKIFAVREVTKTLEDRFLEVTEFKGGAGHARTDSK